MIVLLTYKDGKKTFLSWDGELEEAVEYYSRNLRNGKKVVSIKDMTRPERVITINS